MQQYISNLKLSSHEWYVTVGVGIAGLVVNYLLANWGLLPHVSWVDALYPVLTFLGYLLDGKVTA